MKAIRDCASVTWFGSVFQTEQVSGAKEYFREFVLASGWMKSEVDLDERRLVGGLGMKKLGEKSTYFIRCA